MHDGHAAGTRFLLFLALALPAAAANAAADVYVPEELKPWQAWVLERKEYLGCPFFFDRQPDNKDTFVCAWPGELELAVTEDGGRFAQSFTVYESEQWLALPGDSNHWPQQVTANGEAIAVVMRDSRPTVRLPPGRHAISGRFAWDDRPRSLPVPRETGLLQLTVDGDRVPRPERNDGAVWLGERAAQSQVADTIRVQVYRLVADDVPTRLATRLQVEVSGSMREVLIGPALPVNFVPMALRSKLPVRLEPDGNLRVQVRPGNWLVELHARSDEVLNEVSLAAPEHNLPESEIWSYRSNDRLRVTAPLGLPPVDPEQVSVPREWRELPAFRIIPGESLSIVERSRGKVARDNRLRLERRLWLDFDGGGFVFSDAIGGTMRSDWRLDIAYPYVLMSASSGGDDLLVTLGPAEGLTGVEIRRSDVDLRAIGRIERQGAMPVSGWQAQLNGMTATLNLPPGHKLVAAAGADSARGAWVERWELLDFFLLLIVTLASARLFGWQAGAIAFLALVLSWHESGAPQWAWLNLLAAVALVRVAPEGRLRKTAILYRALSFAALLVLLVPFVAEQLRVGIYPQLEPQGRAAPARQALPPAPVEEIAVTALKKSQLEPLARVSTSLEEAFVSGSPSKTGYARYAPNAIVQAGPGRPSWRWNTYILRWSGPVDPEQSLNLTIMPRWLVTALRIFEVLLLAAFAFVFAFEIFKRRWTWPPRRTAASAPPALAVMLIGSALTAAALGTPGAARADTPTPEILQQLEQRLLEPPPCTPRCAEIAEANVVIGADAMTIELVVHALGDVAVPLPGSQQGWRPESVAIDGADARTVYRGANNTLWIRATEGRRRITLRGPLPPVDSLDVPFPAPPRAVTVQSDVWFVSGIRDRRLLSGSLQLTRLRDDNAADNPARWESSQFPAFARIERTIELDLDWRVHTRVFRIAPQEGALTLRVPLLDGASLLTGKLTLTDGEVLVSMGPSEQTVEWDAALERSSKLALHAAADAPWKEVWRFGIGNIWHAELSGVPESEAESPADGARIAEFYPRGGETLTLHAVRPAASSGTTLAFDRVSVMTEVGKRSRNTVLTLEYRSTRGAQHVIRLPDGAEVLSVRIDGENEPLRASGGELNVPVLPGEHVIEVRWQRDADIGTTVRTPAVDLGAAAGNIALGIDLPADRWILATSGPRLGPAVMYWSELAAMILFALVLGRIRLTPLKTRHWLLLGLGFSTFSWPALTLVAIWLLAAGARRQWQPADDMTWWRFDAAQIVFAALTVAALIAIVVTVPAGLLGSPDMHIAGNGSHGNSLRWFADRSESILPDASVISLPLWVYKGLILAWALWLSFALLRWLPWAWQAFVSQGLWRRRETSA